MKKNVMMRVASALLVAVLMTTCAISGTFAKYTSTATGSDSARVARWGFNTDSITVDMFDGTYTNVQTGDHWNVVAPGTSKETTINFQPAAGTPEVTYTFNVNVSVATSNDVGDVLLGKLVWYLNDTKVGTDGTFEELKAAVDSACDKTYQPGQTPANIDIKWEWAFDGNDTTDTDLGNATVLPSLVVTVTYTATQVD